MYCYAHYLSLQQMNSLPGNNYSYHISNVSMFSVIYKVKTLHMTYASTYKDINPIACYYKHTV